MSSTPTRRSRWLSSQNWLPIVIYLTAALAITWPLITQISTAAIGTAYGDEFERVRLIWWVREAIQHGHNPFYQSLFAYPDGFFSAPQWAEPLAYLPAAAISFITTPLIAYNLWTLIELVLGGWAAFFLCRSVLRDPAEAQLSWIKWGSALIGGLIFMLYPTVQGQLSGGHSGVLTLYAFPLFALAVWRILYRNGGVGTAIGGAVAFAITALGNTDQLVFTLFPLTLFVVLYEAIFARVRFWHWRTLRLFIILFGLGCLLIVPFFAPLAVQLLSPSRSADLTLGGWITYSADPLGYFALSPFTPWGASIAPAYSRIVLGTNSIEGTAYIGIVTLILCLVALIGVRRVLADRVAPLRIWWWVAIGSAIFALGPFLKWHDQPLVYKLGTLTSYVTLPWAIFQQFPVLDASRTPGRFNLTTALAIAVIASAGATFLFSRIRGRGVRIMIGVVLIIGILIDDQLFFPEPMTDTATPAYLTTLASQTNVRAVFDLPWDDPLAAKEALLFQTVHHKPLIAGYVIRSTPVDPAKLNLIQAAITGGLQPANTTSAIALLHQIGVDVVIAHLSYVRDPAATVQQITAVLGVPIYQDTRIAVFSVNPGTSALDPKRLITTPPIADSPPTSGFTIDAYVPPNAPTCRIIHLTASSAPNAILAIDGTPISRLDFGSSAGSSATSAAASADRLIWLSSGFHALHVDQPITADPIDLTANDSDQPNGYTRSVSLSDGLSLRCARVTSTGIAPNGSVRVDMAWHATNPIASDDHLFVHVLDADGKIVAQNDRVPGNGQYPTTQWQADQNWSESILLPNIPTGTYRVEVGWYAYPSLTRIPITDNISGNQPGTSDGVINLGSVSVP